MYLCIPIDPRRTIHDAHVFQFRFEPQSHEMKVDRWTTSRVGTTHSIKWGLNIEKSKVKKSGVQGNQTEEQITHEFQSVILSSSTFTWIEHNRATSMVLQPNHCSGWEPAKKWQLRSEGTETEALTHSGLRQTECPLVWEVGSWELEEKQIESCTRIDPAGMSWLNNRDIAPDSEKTVGDWEGKILQASACQLAQFGTFDKKTLEGTH